MVDELCRCASGGLVWGVCGGLGIGLPPVLHFGSPALQDKIVPGCLAGEKFICLAITEPYAGSDVAGLRCTAKKDPTGKFYVVNGEKKWCVVAPAPLLLSPPPLTACCAGSQTACLLTTSPSRCAPAARALAASACWWWSAGRA